MSRVQSRGEEMIARHGFQGVPANSFDEAGRRQFVALLNQGLNPESKVLEIGCGCLRVAYWLIRFLDRGCYCGIEPARQRVDHGREYLFNPDELPSKQPRFDFNPDFDTSVFGVQFDFFLAGSIWSHASKNHIEVMLDGFLRDSTTTGIFLTSYVPAESPDEDHQGDSWVGTSHESDTPGVIHHSLAWIEAQCEKRGLRVKQLPGEAFDAQFWLLVQRAGMPVKGGAKLGH